MDPKDELAASAKVFEYIVFRGSDIKELNVVTEKPKKEAFVDPAIVNVYFIIFIR